MKIFLQVFMLFALMTNEVTAAEKVEQVQKQPSCKGKGCYVVAARELWQRTPQTRGLGVKSGQFVVKIPSNIASVGIGKTVTVFRYDNAPPVVIGIETIQTFELNAKDINLFEVLEVIFTNTPKDYDISNKYSMNIWNKLMLVKQGFLEQSEKAYIYTKAPLFVYYIPGAGKPFNNIAWAVDKNNPDTALRIESNMSASKFKEILFSIILKEKQRCHN